MFDQEQKNLIVVQRTYWWGINRDGTNKTLWTAIIFNWAVDYLGIGGREYIGKIKQPTITICTLVEDEYQKRLFQNNDQLLSSIFPNLQLTAKQVFASASAVT